MNTRGLQGGVAQRISSETVALEYCDEYDNGDGSATPIYTEVISGASVGALQAHDIKRLEIAGITLKDGVTIVLPFADKSKSTPDYITQIIDEYISIKYRVVAWSIANCITVATCDLVPIESAT